MRALLRRICVCAVRRHLPCRHETRSILDSGMPYSQELKIPAKAVELKLLLGNLASGKIGTLTVPLSDIKGDAGDAKAGNAK